MSDDKTKEILKLSKQIADLEAEYQEFAYIVSHDLNGVLRQVGGFAQIIFDRHANRFDARTTRQFELLIEGADNGRDILDGLLDYSRLNTVDVPIGDVDCNVVVSEVLEKLDELVTFAEARIQVDDLPVIIASGSRISQVFFNLLENALIFRREDVVPEISVSVKETVDLWMFKITDNGIGVQPQHEVKIFDVLQCAGGRHYNGIGMGLAICRKIIRQHDGNIWMNSDYGRGSELLFTIKKSPALLFC